VQTNGQLQARLVENGSLHYRICRADGLPELLEALPDQGRLLRVPASALARDRQGFPESLTLFDNRNQSEHDTLSAPAIAQHRRDVLRQPSQTSSGSLPVGIDNRDSRRVDEQAMSGRLTSQSGVLSHVSHSAYCVGSSS